MPEIVAENISVINSDELESATRIDAEYYQPNFVELQKVLSSKETVRLGKLAKSILSFGAYSLNNQFTYQDKGIPFLRCVDLKKGSVDFKDALHIDETAHKLLWKSEIKPEQVLFGMSGSVGNSAVANKDWVYPINSSQDIAKITLKQGISPYYVTTILNSKYGRFQTQRLPVGSVQQHIFLWQIETILIPLLWRIHDEVSNIAKESERQLRISEGKYKEAELLLLEELGIKDIDLSHEPCYEVNSADTITANRFDAEYYQPKYERVIEAIKNCRFGWCNLDDKIKNVTDKYDPTKEPEKDFRYIELSNINPSIGVINGYSELKGKDLPSRARMLIKEGDVIISSVEGSIDKVALVDNNHDGCIASTGFFVFRGEENTLPEYALVLCKSVLIQKQLEKLASGTILTAVPKNLVQSIIIPNTPKEAQTEIANLIRQSHSARRQAKELLEEAKRKVEEMVEKGGNNYGLI